MRTLCLQERLCREAITLARFPRFSCGASSRRMRRMTRTLQHGALLLGFVIDGGLLLTNAHVVSDARLLLLYLHGDPTPHKARAVMLGHDCDLALVRPDEPGLLRDIPVLQLGGLPPLRTNVETYGYPAG